MISFRSTTQSPRREALGLWLPVAVYMAAIYWGAGVAQVPGPAARFSDTVLHMSGYAGLALVTLRATAKARWSGVTAGAMSLAFVIAVVHGLTVEVEQMFVPTRLAEWRDVGNDVIGTLAGLFGAWAWGKLFKK
ncbi:MAG TPA: VanZ family protein [Vicinamibacterales bacterium]|nr:VanZ family protein [Vicinamibacterales bacterium]